MSVIDTLVTNRSSPVPYNNTDLNRVGLAVNYLVNLFAALGYSTSGVRGDRHTERSTDDNSNTFSWTVVDNYPTDGTDGAAGGSGCVVIWYEKGGDG